MLPIGIACRRVPALRKLIFANLCLRDYTLQIVSARLPKLCRDQDRPIELQPALRLGLQRTARTNYS